MASDIAKTIGGSLFGAVFLTGLIVGQFASGLAAQAAVSRLLYAMGRDRVLPQRTFGWVSERFHTPVFNIALCGVIGLAAIFLDVATSTSFINFGAFTAFTLVNLAVIAYYLRHRDEHLSPWRYILLPAIGAVVDIFLLTQLDSKALILGAELAGHRHRVPAGADPRADQGAAGGDGDHRGRIAQSAAACSVRFCAGVRGGTAFGGCDVSVHRYRGFDPSVGGRRAIDAGGAAGP